MTTRQRTAKVWLSVGVAALVTGSGADVSEAAPGGHGVKSERSNNVLLAADAPAQSASGHSHDHGAAATAPAQGGEGAEQGGEAGGGGLPANVKFLRDIGLIRGHLLVGNELVEQQRWADALPHFHHPIEEIYNALRTPLKTKHIADFDGALKALAQTVNAKKADAYKVAWARVDQRLSEIEASEKSAAGEAWPKTTVQVVLALLQSATGEYGQCIEDGRIAKPVEYQDSRGFVFHAGNLLSSVAPQLTKVNAEAASAIKGYHDDLKAAWPAAVPPEKPVMDHAAVLATVSRFELAAGPFLSN